MPCPVAPTTYSYSEMEYLPVVCMIYLLAFLMTGAERLMACKVFLLVHIFINKTVYYVNSNFLSKSSI